MRSSNLVLPIVVGLVLSLCHIGRAFSAGFTANEQIFITLVGQHWNTPFSVEPISGAHVKIIARSRLDPQVVSQIVTANGVSLHADSVTALAPIQVRIALFELCYLDKATAVRRQQKLPKSRYFEHSKILTPFSSVVTDRCLLVAFTENASNPNAAEFIEKFPKLVRQ